MKPKYLEFCGLNSFSEKAVIDFSKLLSGGLFGIFGATGSGKSTLLDAIHLAIYGRIDRAAGAMADCINYRSDKAYVIFDFEIVNGGERHTYRVRRERTRKAGGVKAYLYRYQADGSLVSLAEGTDEVDEALGEIVGLDFEEFKKCIALPQGEFAGLVKAKPADRIKLVSRLFDLDKYGEKLNASIRQGYEEVTRELNEILARIDENGGDRVEIIQKTGKEIEESVALLNDTKKRYLAAQEDVAAWRKLADEKHAYDGLYKEWVKAEQDFPFYDEARKRLLRVSSAKRVEEKATALEKTKGERLTAAERKAKTERLIEQKTSALAKQKEALLAAGYDEKIEKANIDYGKAQGADADRAAYKNGKLELDKRREEYRTLKDKCPKEDFDGEINKLDEEIAALGGDLSFAEYAKDALKDVVLVEVYGEFRVDLREIKEKFPETDEEVDKLLKKYTLAETGSKRSFDIAEAQLAFKKLKTEADALKKKKLDWEKKKQAYEKNEAEKERLEKEGKIFADTVKQLAEKLKNYDGIGTADEIERKIKAWKTDKEQAEKAVQNEETALQTLLSSAKSDQALEESYKLREQEELAALKKALNEENFASVEEASALLSGLGGLNQAQTDAFFERYAGLKAQLEKFDKTKFENYSDEGLLKAEETLKRLDEEQRNLEKNIAVLEKEKKSLEELHEKYLQYEKEAEEKRKTQKLWEQLRSLTAKNKFMEFIASEYLQDVCAAASQTLLSVTNGRYFLRYDKDFKVGDNFNGGELRAVKTLSGGETFLVSLSLALSLSNAICQKSARPIEFFFLDEGFGTLDGELVDTVMDVLSKVSQTFAVGVISHVEELKNRVENKILVTPADETRGSTVKTVVYS